MIRPENFFYIALSFFPGCQSGPLGDDLIEIGKSVPEYLEKLTILPFVFGAA